MEEAGSDAAAAAAERQALRDAAKAGDAARVLRLLDHGIGAPGIDAPDTHGWSALHHAAQSGSAPAMRALLAHGASHGSRTKNGSTALHVASFNGRLDLCKLLVVHGADVHATDRKGITALEDARYRSLDRCCAVETPTQQWIKCAAFLMKVMRMPPSERVAFARRSWGLRASELLQDAVTTACADENAGESRSDDRPPMPRLAGLLDCLADDVDAKDHDGSTALHAAAEMGRADAAALLIERRADVGALTGVGESPLYLAAREGHAEVCRVLLAAGAAVDVRTHGGTTPADAARREGHAEVCRVLAGDARFRGAAGFRRDWTTSRRESDGDAGAGSAPRTSGERLMHARLEDLHLSHARLLG